MPTAPNIVGVALAIKMAAAFVSGATAQTNDTETFIVTDRIPITVCNHNRTGEVVTSNDISFRKADLDRLGLTANQFTKQNGGRGGLLIAELLQAWINAATIVPVDIRMMLKDSTDPERGPSALLPKRVAEYMEPHIAAFESATGVKPKINAVFVAGRLGLKAKCDSVKILGHEVKLDNP